MCDVSGVRDCFTSDALVGGRLGGTADCPEHQYSGSHRQTCRRQSVVATRYATACASRYEVGGASAHRNSRGELRELPGMPPRVQIPRVHAVCPAVSVVNVGGNESRISFMDAIHAQQ